MALAGLCWCHLPEGTGERISGFQAQRANQLAKDNDVRPWLADPRPDAHDRQPICPEIQPLLHGKEQPQRWLIIGSVPATSM